MDAIKEKIRSRSINEGKRRYDGEDRPRLQNLNVDDLIEKLFPFSGGEYFVDVRLGMHPYNQVVLIMANDGTEISLPFEFEDQY